MDSTTLLIQHLAEAKVDHIYTCYIELEGNTHKIASEKNAIEVLTNQICDSVWASKDHKTKWTHSNYKFSDFPPCNPSEGMMQPVIWMMYAAFEAGAIAEKYDEVEVNIGYVRGDHALKYKDKVMAAWNGMSALTRMDEDPYKLVFPLAGMSKTHIFNRLEKYSLEYEQPFLNTAWVCEDPKRFSNKGGSGFKRCGECGPCKRDPRYLK